MLELTPGSEDTELEAVSKAGSENAAHVPQRSTSANMRFPVRGTGMYI